jgi:flagellin-like hook-associated protein FlgL
VAWESTGQDGSGDGVYGQRYDASAAPIGPEFQINTHTASEQRDVHLASLEGGGFVANWISYNQDGNIWGIYGQRFDSAGNAAGAEFRINTHTANNQQHAQISSLPDGGFLALFGSDSSTHAQPDNSSFGAYGQRYDSSGNPVGAEFRINSTTTGHQYYASATGLKNGNFVITWSSYGQDDVSGHGIYGQRYDASGTAVGSEFKVNSNNSNDQHYSSITSLDDGGFLVVWQSSEQDGSGTGIYGQRYASNGETVGSEFVINSTTNNDQARPSVTSLSDSNIVVAWSSAGQDGDGNGIFAQIFDTGTSSSSGSSYGSSSTTTGSSNSSSSSSSSTTLDSPANATVAITAIDNAIKTVNIQRSKLGAVSNRLSHTVNNLTNISSNLSAAQGGIEDADFAKETTDLAKNQILQQASTAMLAQANASKQNVLSLLQG